MKTTPRQLDRLFTAMLIIGASLSVMIGALADAEVVREQRYTVQDADGNIYSEHNAEYTAVQRAEELSEENGYVPYYVVGNRLRVIADKPEVVEPPVIEPPIIEPPVVEPPDPPTASEGFTAREPDEDAIKLPADADNSAIIIAVNKGKDVLFAAGATYDLAEPLRPRSGQLLGVHGTGDRPIIRCRQFVSASDIDGLTIVGIRLYDPTGNPWADTFDFDADRTAAISLSGSIHNVLIEDCRVEFFEKGITLISADADTEDITIHRNIIRYCWNKGDRGAGIYTNRVKGLTVTENLIDHNGWHPDISGRPVYLIDSQTGEVVRDENGDKVYDPAVDQPLHERGFQAHGCYFSGRYNSGVPDKWAEADKGDEFLVEFHGNIVSRSSANGCQFRLGGNVSDSVFVGNPMALYTWTNASQVHRNAILGGTHIDYDFSAFYRRGWGIQIITGGDYTENLIANVSRAAAGSWAVVYEASSARVTGNTFYNWRPTGKASSVWDKNDGGLDRVTDNRDTIGGDTTATLTAEQIEQIAGRERGVWGDAFDGAAISAEIRRAYR